MEIYCCYIDIIKLKWTVVHRVVKKLYAPSYANANKRFVSHIECQNCTSAHLTSKNSSELYCKLRTQLSKVKR